MATAQPQLRPLSIGEQLDVGIKIAWRNLWTLIKIVAIVAIPVHTISTLVDFSLSEGVFTTGETDDAGDIDWGTFVAGVIIVIAVNVIGWTLSTAAAYKAISDAYLGARPGAGDSLRFGLARLLPLLWISVLSGLLLGGVAAVLLLPPALLGLPGVVIVLAVLATVAIVVWLGVAWAVAVPALLTEDVRGVGALRRSYRLVSRRWWATFAILVLGGLLVSIGGAIISLPITIPLAFADSDLVLAVGNAVASVISSAITTPFLAAFIVVVYFDLRIRKEGFDLQLLAERIGSQPPSAPPGAPPQPPYRTEPPPAQPPPAQPPPPAQ